MENIIEVKGLCKTYIVNKISNNVLRNIDFSLGEGEFVSVMGPSGSGKSTLLYTVSGMDRATAGDITFLGKNYKDTNDREMAKLRLVNGIRIAMEAREALLKETRSKLLQSAAERLRNGEHAAAKLRERLTAVNPLAVMERGFALVYDPEEKLITRAAEARKKDEMILQFTDGSVRVAGKEKT